MCLTAQQGELLLPLLLLPMESKQGDHVRLGCPLYGISFASLSLQA